MKNKMEDLRNHLFLVMEKLQDPEQGNEMSIDVANQITATAQVIVNSAKVEVDFLKQLGGATGSGFISETKKLTGHE